MSATTTRDAASPDAADVETQRAEVVPEPAPEDATRADDELARVTGERDEYLETLQRVQAEYDNYRRRTRRDLAEQLDRGAQQLAEQLLPVLDAFDSAVQHDAPGVEPLRRTLHDALAAAGLERLDPVAAPFDPSQHDALEHEPAEAAAGNGSSAPAAENGSDAAGVAVVVGVLRPGYRWRGRVLRPALVRVRG